MKSKGRDLIGDIILCVGLCAVVVIGLISIGYMFLCPIPKHDETVV